LRPGDIVVVDWRDAFPKEANKVRPAIVVEDTRLFDEDYANVVLVPITEDRELSMRSLSVELRPTKENGCTKRCYAVSHSVTTTSKRRIRQTPSRITAEQLRRIREQIVETIGMPIVLP